MHPMSLRLAATAVVVAGLAAATSASPAEAPWTPDPWRSQVAWISPAKFDPRSIDGKVTIVEFWTFSCINCRRTTPAMRALHHRFGADVAIVGVHTPEFEHERDPAAVRAAIARDRIDWIVAQDNDQRAWSAFHNQYWPALYVLDRAGRVRHVHVGELHEGTARWKEFVKVVDALRREPAKT